jgi:phosphatidylglycerol:prolipoprotein diacylglycerol transferase
VHPIAFKLGPLTVHWYGVLVAIGFLAGMWVAAQRVRGIGLQPEVVMDLGIWMIVAGIIGARTFYVIGSWEEFAANPIEIIRVDHGGLVFYGGFIGAALTAVWFVRRRKLHFWKLADVMAPSVAFAHVFGRLGCFMNGCCYGNPCPHPWAVHFPMTHETRGVGVHPTQLYEAFGNLVIFAGLWLFYPKRKFDGQVFGLYVLTYALWRFGVECFRGDYDVHRWLTPGQAVAVVMFVVAIGLLWQRRQHQRTS